MPGFGQITPTQAMRQIGIPDAPLILDIRIADDLATLPHLIPTARRVAHTAIAAVADPPRRAIVAKGRKLSEGAAAWLRTMGWQAEVLADGTLPERVAGLLALSDGLSRMCHDDLQKLSAGMALYDALYRWARDGHEEGHDWPKARKA